jgi:hypothetical protein
VKFLPLAINVLFVFSITAQCSDSSSAANKIVPKKAAVAPCPAKAMVQAMVQAMVPDTAKLKAAAAVTDKPSQDTLVIVGRCIEIPGKFPPNDLYNYVYIMKYRVMKVIKGVYTGQEILVGHYNPLIPRQRIKDKMAAFVRGNVARFETGAKHTLTLIKPIERIWKDAVEDDYADSDLDKYYALTADVAP